MSNTVSLLVHCQYCGGAMMLQMTDWPVLLTPGGPPNTTQTWACPYCDKLNTGSMPGQVAWVTRGHEKPAGPN